MKTLLLSTTVGLVIGVSATLWSTNNKIEQLEQQNSKATKDVASLTLQVKTLTAQLTPQTTAHQPSALKPSTARNHGLTGRNLSLQARATKNSRFARQPSSNRVDVMSVKTQVKSRQHIERQSKERTKDPAQPETLDNGIVL
ncbi:hypothetical protein [Thalassotalea aquiviva]|uniref:hypothetical protein n=1 Tax=Thalassotalea aquiviva TaxID=3242415 RepID=UPI00352B0713